MSRPLKLQIVEKARALIADEGHWCREHLAQDNSGLPVSPMSASTVRWCGLGALIAAAYHLTHDFDAACELGHAAMYPDCAASTLILVNDTSGHAAVLALFDEIAAAG